MPSAQRLRPPGTEWLYAKLYCPSRCEDELISERLLPMAQNAVASGLADSWFFIRYGDPDGHIRLRFHGDAERLSSHLFSQLSQWSQGMMDDGLSTRITFDTYDREIERFGGPEGMAVAERIFHADSRAAAALVNVLRSKQWEDPNLRTALFALSVDDLCRVCGFNDTKRLEWYKGQATNNGPDAGTEYRKLKTQLRRALGDRTNWLSEVPFGEAISEALNHRAADLSDPSNHLLQLAADGALSQPLEKILASYAHLHLNRIGAASAERTLLSLLFRTRASLANAPL